MQVAPEAYAALSGLGRYIEASGLEPMLVELVKVRAWQIDACAFCLDMHSRDARRHGETEQRLYLLNAWREAPGYGEWERAALGWTDCLTLVASQGAPDTAHEALFACRHQTSFRCRRQGVSRGRLVARLARQCPVARGIGRCRRGAGRLTSASLHGG